MVGFHDECPDPGLLLDVRRRVNSLSVTQPGPILVHCRCGGGRTAVYVAVDYCLHQLHSEDRVDVYSTVLHLRRFRKNMIRTLAQYEQIYQAVAMYLQCGTTVYPAQALVAAYQVHYSSEAKAFKLEREFQTLQSIVPRLSIGDCASGHRVENRSKSRDIMMLPPECARPYLSTADCGESGTDFINAVYIDGYHTENTYLATQWPLKRTIADFWRMLFDFKITSLVLMNDLHKFTRSYPRFWPKEVDHVASYGPINVRYLSCSKLNHTTIRTFAIRKPKRHPHLIAQTLLRISEDVMIMNNLVGCEVRQDEVIVKMFQVLSSVSDSLGKCYTGHNSSLRSHSHGSSDIDTKSKKKGIGIVSKSLLTVMEHASDWQRRNNSRQPICVMSKDGCSRVGLYCAINFCCDQVKAEKEVDVFNAVRLVRKNRPQLIPNLEEYRYIYHFMSEFILLSATKPDIFDAESPMGLASHSGNFYQTAKSQVCSSSSFHGGVYVININKEEKDSKKENYSDIKAEISCELHGDEPSKISHNDICKDKMFTLNSVTCQNLIGENNQAPLFINLFPNGQSATNFSLNNQQRTSSGQTAVSSTTDGLTVSYSALRPVDLCHPVTGLSTQCQESSLSSFNKPSITLSPVPYFQQPSHFSGSFDSNNIPVHSMISSDSSSSFITPDISSNCRAPSHVNPCNINISQSPLNSSFVSCHSNGSVFKKEIPETNQYSFHNGGIPSSDLTQTIVQHSSRSTKIQNIRNYQNQTSVGNGAQHSVRFNEVVLNGQLPSDIKLIHASYASLEESSSSEDDHEDSLDCIIEEQRLKHVKVTEPTLPLFLVIHKKLYLHRQFIDEYKYLNKMYINIFKKIRHIFQHLEF
ncbi:hypothetical protein Btru_007514 [Bulinus truncatus]|nr:hypothetical protein Btru_007514 [Bulinus truncatus]